MANEPTALGVCADSPLRSFKDLVERFRTDLQTATRELMAKDYEHERAMLTELGMVTKP